MAETRQTIHADKSDDAASTRSLSDPLCHIEIIQTFPLNEDPSDGKDSDSLFLCMRSEASDSPQSTISFR